MGEAYIIDACRTPRGIGKLGKGALADIHPQQLAATVLKAIAKRNDLNTAEVDDIIWGTSTQRGKQAMDLGRMAALDAGYDTKASGGTEAWTDSRLGDEPDGELFEVRREGVEIDARYAGFDIEPEDLRFRIGLRVWSRLRLGWLALRLSVGLLR